jgi:hypothetical protein
MLSSFLLGVWLPLWCKVNLAIRLGSTDTSRIRRVSNIGSTLTHIITLNYVVFLNYQGCWCVTVCIVSGVLVCTRDNIIKL